MADQATAAAKNDPALVESLRQTEEQFERLVASVRDYAIFTLDIHGNVTSWNTGARQIKGYEAHEIIGRNVSVFYPPEVAASGWPQRELEAATRLGHFEDEGWRVRKDGTQFWANVVITALMDDAGSLRGFLKITRDLTERRAAEERLRRAHDELEQRVLVRTAELERTNEQLRDSERRFELADRRKDQFLAVLAHELRNPLAPVRTAVEIMRRLETDDPRLRKSMTVIDRQIAHMTRLVDDLLDVSRISSGKVHIERERLDLCEVVRAVVEDHRDNIEQRGLTLEVELPSSPLWIEGDDTRLSQAVGNLVGNAIKFTPGGGRICVAVAQEESRAVLSVSDTGVGIRPQLLERVFEPFAQGDETVTRTHGGLGLGLALVRGLVRLHGGSIDAASAGVGHGATFTVRLPVVEPPATEHAPVRAPAGPATSRTVLVIEDNIDAADTMAMFLTTVGHRVRIANTGASGIAMAEELRPELVICDIGLTDMSGLDVARHLRRVAPNAYLLALTGYGQQEDRLKSQEAGFHMHATKPMDMGALDSLVANLGVQPRARQ